MSNKKDNKKIIRISASSNIYEYNNLIPENRAEGVLKTILRNYKNLDQKYSGIMEITKLEVTTSVHNPELF